MNYDIVFLHPPSVYDFRKKPWFPGYVAGTIRFTPVFEAIPIGFISMAEYAERHGYKVKIFNLGEYMLTNPKFDPEEFIKKIQSDFFGIGLHFCVHSQGALEIARICKLHHEDSNVVVGGLTATKFSNELIMNHHYVDYVIRGEGEIPLLKLLDTNYPEEKIPNLLFRDKEGRIKESRLWWSAEDINKFDYTRLDLVDPKNLLINIYTKLGNIKQWMIPICRGCLYNCATCGGSRYTYSHMFHRKRTAFRSKEKIIEDLQKLSDQGVESVFLFGDVRMGGKKYWKSLLKTLASSDIGVKYLTMELFTPGNMEFLSEIIRLNNSIKVGLSISPESGNEMVRTAQGRPYTNESLIKTAKYCSKNGIRLGVFFMFGLALETEESLEDTYNLCVKLIDLNFENGSLLYSQPVIRPQFGEMLLLDPGSPAFDNPEKYGYKLLFKTLQDYVNGLSSPAWSDWLSYETQTSTRRELLERPRRFDDKIISYYHSIGLISDEQAEFAHRKNKIGRIILEELETIRKIKQVKRKEKRYWAIYRALKSSDKGKLSIFWRIKKKLGILDLL